MAVRNFWVECNIDGRSTSLTGGPQAKDGGMVITIKQRNEGGIITAMDILCKALDDGTLVTTVCTPNEQIEVKRTNR